MVWRDCPDSPIAVSSNPLKKSFGLRAAQIRRLFVAESRRISPDMPSIRLLDPTNLAALSPAKHFFNGLLDGDRDGLGRLLRRVLPRTTGSGGDPLPDAPAVSRPLRTSTLLKKRVVQADHRLIQGLDERHAMLEQLAG